MIRAWVEPPPRETLSAQEASQPFTLRSSTDETINVVVEGEPPSWLMPTVNALQDLLRLPAGWNSYGAVPIEPRAVVATIELMASTMDTDTPAPHVVPTNRGGVQLEWHQPDVDLEIQVLAPGRFAVAFEDFRTGREWEGEVTSDMSRLRDFMTQLSHRA